MRKTGWSFHDRLRLLALVTAVLIAVCWIDRVNASTAYPGSTALQSLGATQEVFLRGPFYDNFSFLAIYLPDGPSPSYSIERWVIQQGAVERTVAMSYELPHGGVCEIIQHGTMPFSASNKNTSGIRFVCTTGVSYIGAGAQYSTISTFFVMSDDGSLCEQDATSTSQISATPTPPSLFKAVSYAPIASSASSDASMILIGGSQTDASTYQGVYKLSSVGSSGNTVTSAWSTPTSSSAYGLANSSSAYHAPTKRLYVFGGYSVSTSSPDIHWGNQMIFIDTSSPSYPVGAVATYGPSPRQGHAMVLINATDALGRTYTLPSPNGGDFFFFFGGMDTSGNLIAEGDDWGFEIATQMWFNITIPASIIPRRTATAMVAASDGPYAIIYGGTDRHYNPTTADIYKVDFSVDASPVAPLRPQTSSPSPTAPPPPMARACALPQPTGFDCVDGTWVSEVPIVTTTISIPNAPVIVVGDFNVSEVTLGGLGSSIQLVNGCAAIDSVTVTLTEAELEELAKSRNGGRQLISQASYCNTFSSSISVSVKAPKSCKKVSATSSGTNTNTLSALFAVDSKSCQNRWIILGCVLGGVLLIILILLLVFTQNNKARECIRPYSKRRVESTN